MPEFVGNDAFAVEPVPLRSQRVVVDVDASSQDRTPGVDWATITVTNLVDDPGRVIESGFPTVASFSTAVDVAEDGTEVRVSRLVPIPAGTGGRFSLHLEQPLGHVALAKGEWTVDLLLPPSTADYEVDLVDYTADYNAEVFRSGKRIVVSWFGTESPLDVVYRYLGGP